MLLFLNTGTTGKYDFKSPPDAPNQPRLVRVTALLTTEETGQDINAVDLVINPENKFEIPPQRSLYHGVTTDDANKYGVKIETALMILWQMYKISHRVVGHNAQYSISVINGELLRHMQDFDKAQIDKQFICTMKEMTPFCAIPSVGHTRSFKWPKLSEAYHHAMGRRMICDNAIEELKATKQIYLWLKSQKRN